MKVTPAILVEHLFFGYDTTPLISAASFRIEEGTFVAVIGPNGGGKTTLLQLIMGFLRQDRGRIFLFGKEERDYASASLAFVPQRLPFDKQFPITLLEVVLQGRVARLPWYGRFSSKDVAAAKDAIARVGLTPHTDARFGDLSGGQIQRGLIARAIVSEPRLLLMDEPTSNLDPQAQREIGAILLELKRSMTVLMVTHDLVMAIGDVDEVLCVRGSVKKYSRDEVCKHFAMGLYHTPLWDEKTLGNKEGWSTC